MHRLSEKDTQSLTFFYVIMASPPCVINVVVTWKLIAVTEILNCRLTNEQTCLWMISSLNLDFFNDTINRQCWISNYGISSYNSEIWIEVWKFNSFSLNAISRGGKSIAHLRRKLTTMTNNILKCEAKRIR